MCVCVVCELLTCKRKKKKRRKKKKDNRYKSFTRHSIGLAVVCCSCSSLRFALQPPYGGEEKGREKRREQNVRNHKRRGKRKRMARRREGMSERKRMCIVDASLLSIALYFPLPFSSFSPCALALLLLLQQQKEA